MAAPLTAQITGWGMLCMAGTRSANNDMARLAMGSSGSSDLADRV